MPNDQRLIEDYIPIEAISAEARPEAPAAPAEIQPPSTAAQGTDVVAQPEAHPTEQPRYDARRTHLRLGMTMSRQQLFAAWNAFKNLAEAVGSIHITLEVHKPQGFDPTWQCNAVYEPLDDADIRVDES